MLSKKNIYIRGPACKHIKAHSDYQAKVTGNGDNQNREIAFKKILDDVMRQQRKKELDLYKLYAKDDFF